MSELNLFVTKLSQHRRTKRSSS